MDPTSTIASLLAAVAGVLCCGGGTVAIIGLVLWLIKRSRGDTTTAAPAAAPASLPEPPPDLSGAGEARGAPEPVPVAAPSPFAPPPPAPAPSPSPFAPPPPQPGAPSGPFEQLEPFDETAEEDPTVLARPDQLGIIRPTATTPVPPDPSASMPWQAPTERVVPRPIGPAPTRPTLPEPPAQSPDFPPPSALRSGMTIIPDDDMLDEFDGDETVVMSRPPRKPPKE
jgi:hypothetical protein